MFSSPLLFDFRFGNCLGEIEINLKFVSMKVKIFLKWLDAILGFLSERQIERDRDRESDKDVNLCKKNNFSWNGKIAKSFFPELTLLF